MGTVNQDVPTDDEHRARVREILDDARFVMLLTRGRNGEVHARPMSVARVAEDGTIYFSTDKDSVKVDQLEADPRVELVFQGKTQYAHVAGTARLSHSRALIDELWKPDWKIWYPQGKDDPSIAILVVDPHRGEYWDQSGTKGLSFLYRAAKAFVKGEEMHPRPDGHGKVSM